MNLPTWHRNGLFSSNISLDDSFIFFFPTTKYLWINYMCIYICIHIYIYIYVCIYICHIYEYIDTQWTHPTLDRHCPSPAHRIQLCLARCSRCRRHGGAGDGGGDGGGDEKTEAEEEQNDGALGLLWDNCGIIIFCLIFHCG